ncbi:hypothetical protein B0T17DRAFT_510997 [Bombardia bombarda]|uniref:Uncharacterized protein n=1 Tax=Bombardia bombarda TaxID=252184 RepID=A0AA39WH23_9PEZI|nr:hypothetical protein B0T17DRAFT_510997 [Bombardia bombarda]
MKTTMINIAFAALTSLVIAAPTEVPAKQSAQMIETRSNVISEGVAPLANVKRAITHLYVCDSANFQGRCENLETTTGQCYGLFNGWNDAISSLGPDAGTTCVLYENYDCAGRTLGGIVNPGIRNLVDYSFNDLASSYRCS